MDDTHLEEDERESLGPAVGAEESEKRSAATEEIFEVEPSSESTPSIHYPPTSVRDSLSLLLSDVDSASRLRVVGYQENPRDVTDGDDAAIVLQKREADLELAAKVGRALVQKNQALEHELTMSSARQTEMEESVNQLAHELAQKEELLRQMTKEWRDQEFSLLYPRSYDSDGESDAGRYLARSTSPSICSEDLQEECRNLKVANTGLVEEGHRLRLESIQMERQESELISQCLQKLNDADDRIAWLIQDSDEKAIEVKKHDEEASRLKDHLGQLSEKSEEFVKTDKELRDQLTMASQREMELQTQVDELQNKYEECHGMLKAAQEEVQYWREKNLSHSPSSFRKGSSLQDELQEAVESETFDPRESSPSLTSTPQKKKRDSVRTREVLETVSAVSEAAKQPSHLLNTSLDSGLAENLPGDETYSGDATLVAAPGSVPGLVERKAEIQWQTVDRVHIFSAPEKLQIVKPLEGSRTLHKWQMLASDRSVRLEKSPSGTGIKMKQREAKSPLPKMKSIKEGQPVRRKDGLVHRSSFSREKGSALPQMQVEAPKEGGGLQSFAYLSNVLSRSPVGGLISRKQSAQIARLLGGMKVVDSSSSPVTVPTTVRSDSDESLE